MAQTNASNDLINGALGLISLIFILRTIDSTGPVRKAAAIPAALSLLPLIGTTLSGAEMHRIHRDAALAVPFSGPIHMLYGGAQSPNIATY